MKICVFGAASDEINKNYIEKTEELGREMAARGHELVFGAGANGLMGAVARGVYEEKGKIYGIIPKFFKIEEIEAIFDKCDELIYTVDMAERKATMEDLADAFVVVPGGMGTMEEFFQVLTSKQLARHRKPIVIYDMNNYYRHIEDFLEYAMEESFIRENCKELYCYTDNMEKVFEYLTNDEQKAFDVHDLKIG